MGDGAWQRGAERKLGEREKPSEVSLRLLLNFPSTQSEKKKEKHHVSLCKGGRTKEKVGRARIYSELLVSVSRRLTRLSNTAGKNRNHFVGLISL